MPQMHFVLSSHIVAIGYDEDQQAFHVRYGPMLKHPAGRVAIYQGVPPDVAQDIMQAPSIGGAVSAMLKDTYPFEYQ